MNSTNSTMTTRGKKILYWVTTGFAALALAAIAGANIFRVPAIIEGLTHLGYPAYFATILGVWKLLGVAAIVAPGMSRLKDLAYAGFFFVLTGAATSHAVAGDPVGNILFPLVLLGFVVASWALRPAREAVVAAKLPAPQAA